MNFKFTAPGKLKEESRRNLKILKNIGRRNGTGVGEGAREPHGREDWKDDQRAPIFLQFVDALWQIQRQHPTAFEFNERALCALVDHSYSGAFGTFALDCEEERSKAGLCSGSGSLWDLLLHPSTREGFTNPHFAGELAAAGGGGREREGGAPLLPSRASFLPLATDVRMLQVWPLWVVRFGQ